MHWTLRAPELSATSKMVRICTIANPLLQLTRGLGDDAADAPSLIFRERLRLDDHYPIAFATRALFVMRHETPPLLHALSINRMLHQAIHLDHHGFRHLGGNHGSFAPFNSLPHRSSWFPFPE